MQAWSIDPLTHRPPSMPLHRSGFQGPYKEASHAWHPTHGSQTQHSCSVRNQPPELFLEILSVGNLYMAHYGLCILTFAINWYPLRLVAGLQQTNLSSTLSGFKSPDKCIINQRVCHHESLTFDWWPHSPYLCGEKLELIYDYAGHWCDTVGEEGLHGSKPHDHRYGPTVPRARIPYLSGDHGSTDGRLRRGVRLTLLKPLFLMRLTVYDIIGVNVGTSASYLGQQWQDQFKPSHVCGLIE